MWRGIGIGLREDYDDEGDEEAGEEGQMAGDIISLFLGGEEIAGSGSAVVAAQLAAPETLGGSELLVPGAIAVGAHGIGMAASAGNDLVTRMAEHKKNKRASTYDKHSGSRSGNKNYDAAQNHKKGGQNKKYMPKPNPNVKGNPKPPKK